MRIVELKQTVLRHLEKTDNSPNLDFYVKGPLRDLQLHGNWVKSSTLYPNLDECTKIIEKFGNLELSRERTSRKTCIYAFIVTSRCYLGRS